MENDFSSTHPIGYWITAVDRLLAERFATAFEEEGITRRDWRVLNAIESGTKLPSPKLRRLAERGWVIRTAEGWVLSDEGREARERLGAVVAGIRAQLAEAISAEDYERTVRSLAGIARAFGWEEGASLPRRSRRNRGRGRGRHRGGCQERGDGCAHARRGRDRERGHDFDRGGRGGRGGHPRPHAHLGGVPAIHIHVHG